MGGPRLFGPTLDLVPTLEENFQTFEVRYDWPQQGEEWSAAWGSAEAQWYGTIFPRIHAFVPTGTILEIAPASAAGRTT